MFLNINSSRGVDLAEPRFSNTRQKMTTGKDEPANMIVVLSKDVIYSSSICLAKHVTTLARHCHRPLVLGSGVNKEHDFPNKVAYNYYQILYIHIMYHPFGLFCCYFLIWSSFFVKSCTKSTLTSGSSTERSKFIDLCCLVSTNDCWGGPPFLLCTLWML